MSSTNSACLATPFKIKGINYSITSACSTSAHCIGNAVEQIQWGKQDVVFAGGGEEVDWTLSCLFDAMGAMSSKYNDAPTTASRAFDATRDGFVIAGGAGVVVLEELERAKARGARIYAEVTGYGATSDGHDMVAPSGEGAERCMQLAIETLGDRKVNYINAHGTSTPAGDVTEVEAVRRVFGDARPPISSTKSLTGHSLGATGVQEAIYCLLMLQNDFITASANITELDPALDPAEIATTRVDAAGLDTVLSNSFGFGGTNATLALSGITAEERAMSGLMKGKRGLVMGVANDHSIAWGCAKVLHAQGAELAFTYQGEQFGKRVKPLADSVGATHLLPADVQDEASLDAVVERLGNDWGSLDFVIHAIAYSDKNELQGRFADTSRANFLNSLDISCYSLVDMSRRVMPLMTEGGSIVTMSYLGAQRVMPNYNVMGVAKAALEASVRYLANDLGPQGIRVNALSPGPMRTLAGSAVGGARRVYKAVGDNAPMRANAALEHVGGAAMWLCSDYGASTTGEVIFVDGGYHSIGMAQLEQLPPASG